MSDSTPSIPAEPKFKASDIGNTCLVTGGAGYLGSALVKRLRKTGCNVVSLDVVEHDHNDKKVRCIAADLRHYDSVLAACEGVDTVFHTAALINLLSYYRPAQKRLVYEVNCVGTRNIVSAANACGVSALVQTSSFNVVLNGVHNEADESIAYADGAPDLYSQTKIESERCVLQADQAGGLRTCALRPGGIWSGDCDSMMIRSFLDSLGDGKFTVLIGSRKSTMDNTHRENLLDAQLLAAKALRKEPEVAGGQAYFITDNERVNGLVWFQPLVEALGYKFPKLSVPAGVMKLVTRGMEVAHFMGGPEPELTLRGIRNLTESSSFKIDKARKELGYEPRINRDNGFAELIPLAEQYLQQRRKAAA